MRQRAVRAGRDDRRERHRLGAHPAHRHLEVERHVALGAPREAPFEDLLERRVGQLRGGAQTLDLPGVLDGAQLLDPAAGGDELDALGQRGGELRVLLDAEVLVVEPDAALEAAGRVRQELLGDLALPAVVELLGGLGEVAEVRDEAPDALADDGQPRRPGEAGEPADVDGARDEDEVGALLGGALRQAVGAGCGGVHASSFPRRASASR